VVSLSAPLHASECKQVAGRGSYSFRARETQRKNGKDGSVAIVAQAGLTLRIAAHDDDEAIALAARLTNFQQTPLTLSTPARGTFRAVFEDGPSIEFRLSYSGFTSNVAVAHIHIGAPATTGGVTVFLCGGDGRPVCPGRAGTVTGTITAANIPRPPGTGPRSR